MLLRGINYTHQDLLFNANGALSGGCGLWNVQSSIFYPYVLFLYKTILQCKERLNVKAAQSVMPAAWLAAPLCWCGLLYASAEVDANQSSWVTSQSKINNVLWQTVCRWAPILVSCHQLFFSKAVGSILTPFLMNDVFLNIWISQPWNSPVYFHTCLMAPPPPVLDWSAFHGAP